MPPAELKAQQPRIKITRIASEIINWQLQTRRGWFIQECCAYGALRRRVEPVEFGPSGTKKPRPTLAPLRPQAERNPAAWIAWDMAPISGASSFSTI
jgi:hypothetical protein